LAVGVMIDCSSLPAFRSAKSKTLVTGDAGCVQIQRGSVANVSRSWLRQRAVRRAHTSRKHKKCNSSFRCGVYNVRLVTQVMRHSL
jgi:hypothetical protein